MFKQFIITITILGICFAQGAAEDTQESLLQLSDPFEIIGFKCGSRGECHLIADLANPDSTKCSFTFVYSEDFKLKQQDILESIATNLHNEPSLSEVADNTEFNKICEDEITKNLIQASEDQEESAEEFIKLIALRMQLTVERLRYNANVVSSKYNSSIANGSGSSWLSEDNSAVATCFIPIESNKFIESAQKEAEQLQEQNSNEKFHVVLDLHKWKHIVAERRAEAEEARRIQQESTPSDPLLTCLQQ